MLVSPNEMVAEAKNHMLDGREPESEQDWMLVMNFIVFNAHPDVRESVCLLLRTLYAMPITEQDVVDIVRFHQSRSN